MSGMNPHQGHPSAMPPTHPSSLQQTQISIRVITNSVINTLHFLGFDFAAAEKQYKFTFNLSTFTKPNPKAFELVVHFLLSQLDPERAQRAFSQCWPAILKEQQKDFKDIIFNWLTELSTKSAAAPASAKAASGNPVSSSMTVNAYHQSILQQIKFPIINKSLFLSPGGLKICELLMDLTLYVLLFRLVKLVETNKTNVRIPPKVSLLPNVLNENKQQAQHASGVRLLTAKQLLQFEVQITSIKRMIASSVDDFQLLLQDQLKIRARLQQYAAEKRKSIAATMERTQELKNSLAKKRALAAQLLQADEPTNVSLDSLYEKFSQSTVEGYNRAFAEFEQITRDGLFSNPLAVSNIDQILKVKTDHHVIDGADFSKNVSCELKAESDPNKVLNEKIFKFIYENMDRNETIRNTKIGDLFDKEDKKLNIVNLVRLFNSVLLLKGDLLYKINVNELNKFHKTKNSADETMQDSKLLLLDIDFMGTSATSTASQDSTASEPPSVNRQAAELKKRLEAYLPKLGERIDSLTRKMTASVRLNNNEVRDASEARDEYEKLNIMATELFSDFISTSKRPLVDKAKLEEALSQQVESSLVAGDLGSEPHFDRHLQQTDEKPPNQQSKEFLSETGHDEMLQSSMSASCESLSSTKIVHKANTLAPPPVADIANPLSPINHSDTAPEEEDSTDLHSSLQIIDFSNDDDSNMDLI